MKLSVLTATILQALCSIHAHPELVIYNTTDTMLYGRAYYIKDIPDSNTHMAASDVYSFEPCAQTTIPRPPRRYHWTGWYQRYVRIADDIQELDTHITDTSLLMNIGTLRGSYFYLDARNGTLQGYNALAWNTRMLQEALEAVFCFLLEEVREQHGEHPHSTMQALIRGGTDIAHEEKAYIAKREAYIRQTAPARLHGARIAFCASGGGYRAMISTMGYVQGAAEIGLLDAATYIAGVSGSTWSIAGFVQSGLSIADYIATCADHIEKSFVYDHDSDQVASALLKQFAFTQNITLIDFYGALLAQKILKPLSTLNPHDVDLFSQSEKVADGTQIFPIYAALFERPHEPYAWMEFTPYEVSSSCLGAAVPAWAFGRTFFGGSSTDFSPSQSLGFYMGIWGSALSANLHDVAQRYSERLVPGLLAKLLQNVVQSLAGLSQSRLSAAEVCNWTVGTTLPYAHMEKLRLLDAGLDCNLPLVPLLNPQRAIDVIIVLDATYYGDQGSELRRAQKYAQQHQLPFPPIDDTQMHLPCSVHADWENPAVPVILYIPLRKHPGYQHGWDPYQENFIGTFNFKYTREQMLLLSGLTAHSIRESKPIIFDTIARVIARKAQVRLE